MIQRTDDPWQPSADLFAEALRDTYRSLLDVGLPADLGRIATQIDEPPPRVPEHARIALVAEADADLRSLAAALLEETPLAVVECASAEAALAILIREGDRTAFLLADEELSGPRNGERLASTVRVLWPGIQVVVATGATTGRPTHDPDGIVRIGRPWRGIDILVEAERAVARAA